MDILEYLRRKRMGMIGQPNPFNPLPARPGMNNNGVINTLPARIGIPDPTFDRVRPRPLPMRPGMMENIKPTPLPMRPGMGEGVVPTPYSNSINPPWGVNPRGVGDDITIPPARRVNTPGVFDPATGQNRVARQGPTMTPYSEGYMMSDEVPTPLGFAETMSQVDEGISEPPKESMEYAKKMHSVQEAFFNGADFGYETEWNQALGVTNRMIDLVMSTPVEAMVFAAQNPTDMVLEEFERKYGWPINVNSESLMRYIASMSQ